MLYSFDKLLSEIDVEIAKIDLYDNDIIENSFSMVHRLRDIITDLRNELQTYSFPTQEDEIRFIKVQEPELFGRLLYFHKICRRPLKSICQRDIFPTKCLADFFDKFPKKPHGSFEVVCRRSQKGIHGISEHTFIEVAP